MLALNKLMGKIKYCLFVDNRGAVSSSFVVLTAGAITIAMSTAFSVKRGLENNVDGIVTGMLSAGTQSSSSGTSSSSNTTTGNSAIGGTATGISTITGNTATGSSATSGTGSSGTGTGSTGTGSTGSSGTGSGSTGTDTAGTDTTAEDAAIAQLVHDMAQEQFPDIPPDHMQYLQTSQLAAANSSWWFGQIQADSMNMLSATQIQAVSPSVLGPSAGKLTAQQIGWMTDGQISAVNGGGPIVNMIKTQPAILSKISESQIATVKDPWWFGQLISASNGNLSQKQIGAAGTWALSTTAGKLTAQQIGWMTDEQIAAVTGGDAIVGMVKTEPDLLSKITPDQIATIAKPWWFGQLINASGGNLSEQQIEAALPTAVSTNAGKLTAQQIGWMTKDQIAAVTGGDAIVGMVKTKPAMLSELTPDQIATINSDWWFGQLVNASDGKLSKQQIKAALPAAMSTNTDKLTEQQIGWLTKDQVKGVKGGGPIVNMVKTKPALMSEITPDQIATIKDPWWFGQMPKPLLQGMSEAQVGGIPSDIYPTIKASLSSTQQEWRD